MNLFPSVGSKMPAIGLLHFYSAVLRVAKLHSKWLTKLEKLRTASKNNNLQTMTERKHHRCQPFKKACMNSTVLAACWEGV